jgi:DNA-binding transcriptional ArsR family regulator
MDPKPKHRDRKHAAGVNAAIFKALSHPLRYRILTVLQERIASPTELAETLEEDRYTVARHVRDLAEAGCIELVDTDRRKGGTQHFYKATVSLLVDVEAAERLPRLLREAQTTQIVQLMIGDVIESIEARVMDSHPQRSLLRTNLVLDDEGIAESAEAAVLFWEELQEIQARAAGRLNEAGETGKNMSSGIMIFPAPDGP